MFISTSYAAGMMVRLAKSPPELFPTQRPTKPFLRFAQQIYCQTRVLRVADEDAHLRVRNDNACAEPSLWIRYRIHRLLVFSRLFRAQLLPRVDRKRVVLDGVAAADGVGGFEIEWAEV